MVVGHQFFATGLIVLRLSDVMLIHHARQHHVAARDGAIVGTVNRSDVLRYAMDTCLQGV